MKLLLIDNFDSFVYNLYQLLAQIGCRVDVARNNEIRIEQALGKKYDLIVISPGPGNPNNQADFGVCSELIRKANRTPVLGVCLGHQGIFSCFGGEITMAEKPMHGKTSLVKHTGKGLFFGVKNPLKVMRYHSLVARESTTPGCLAITARSLDDNAVMAIEHKTRPIFGVQFHPESILSQDGKKILENFCKMAVAK